MLERDEIFKLNRNVPERFFKEYEKPLFFDIETTGLSPKSAEIYLIGVVYQDGREWHFHQWFSESFRDEEKLLVSFREFIKPYKTILHYNGDCFDLPFIQKTGKSYGLSFDLQDKASVDLLKIVRSLRKVLPLDSFRQKSLETFLGINRKDVFSGGELIEIYETYRDTKDEKLLKALLLHNEDDLKGMPDLLAILSYKTLFRENPELTLIEQGKNKAGTLLNLRYDTPYEFATCLTSRKENGVSLSLTGRQIELSIPLCYGELKSFLPHPENYYYLPNEDMVVHKTLAKTVDKAYRVPAAKEQCFVKYKTDFVPALKELSYPLFRKDYEDTETFFPVDKIDLEQYVKALLKSFVF